ALRAAAATRRRQVTAARTRQRARFALPPGPAAGHAQRPLPRGSAMTSLRRCLFALSAATVIGPLSAQQGKPDGKPAAAPGTQQALRDDAAAERLGWRLAVQAWTFNDRTAFEAIDTARALGIKYIELFPDQKLAPAHGDVKVAVDMKDALRD